MKKDKSSNTKPGSNPDQQAVDKAPGEERGKQEKVSKEDLKGKKVDADVSNKDKRSK